jgi:hypothetical protein
MKICSRSVAYRSIEFLLIALRRASAVLCIVRKLIRKKF